MTQAPKLPPVVAGASAAIEALMLLNDERAALVHERTELARAWEELKRERAELARERAELARQRREIAEARAELERMQQGPAKAAASVWASPWVEMDGERLIVPERVTYAWCCAFRRAPSNVRMQASAGRRTQFLRISRMWPHFGEALDAAGIAFRWIRYVAYGDGPMEQEGRFQQIMRGERPKPPPRPRRLRRR